MWVLTPRMKQALCSFQHRFTQSLAGRQPRFWLDGRWDYPLLTAAMLEAGFEDIGVYVMRRWNMVAQYIATRPIMYLCERSVRRPGAWVSWRWWEKEGLDLEGAKERAAAESDGEEVQGKEGTAQEDTKGR